MKVIIIAAMTPSGVIGRTSKPCERCGGLGRIWSPIVGDRRDPEIEWCPARCREGRILCNDLPWGRAYPEIDAHVAKYSKGNWPAFVPTDHYFTLAQHIAFARREGHSCVAVLDSFFFAEALPIADELDLTLIGREYDGGVKFPLGGSFYRLGMGLTQSIDSVRCGLGSTTRSFECVSREPSTNPDLTFTKWVRR